MKNNLKNMLLLTIAGSSLFAAGSIIGNSSDAFGDTLSYSNTSHHVKYLYYDNDGQGHEGTDLFATASINGGWVFCIEPGIDSSITPNAYGSRPITDFDTSSSTITIRRTKGFHSQNRPTIQGSQSATPLQLKGMTYAPWVIKNMTDEMVDAIPDDIINILGHNIVNDQASPDTKRSQFKTWLQRYRALPEDVQFMLLQGHVWQFSGSQAPGYLPEYSFTTINNRSQNTAKLQSDLAKYREARAGESLRQGFNGKPLTSLAAPAGINSSFHAILNMMNELVKQGIVEYKGGASVQYSSDSSNDSGVPGQAFSAPMRAKFELSYTYLKANKQIERLKDSVGVAGMYDNMDLSGIRIGVYSDPTATTKVGELTTDRTGQTATLKIKRGTYYLYELDTQGNPVMSDGKFVNAGLHTAGRGDDRQWYESVTTTPRNTQDNPAVVTFKNVPVLANFDIAKKGINNIHEFVDADEQFSLAGAVYGLYKDAAGRQPVTRPNGTPITTTIGANNLGSFTDVVPGNYYVKEISVPIWKVGHVTLPVSRYGIDSKAYPVSLTKTNSQSTKLEDGASNIGSQTFEYNYAIGQGLVTSVDTVEKHNTPTMGKEDTQTGQNTPQGQATFDNANYEVIFRNVHTKEEVVTARYRTKADGTFSITDQTSYISSNNEPLMRRLFQLNEQHDNWAIYSYSIREIKPPQGYHLNPASQDLTARLQAGTNGQGATATLEGSRDLMEDVVAINIRKTQLVDGDLTTQIGQDNLFIPGTEFTLTGTNYRSTTQAVDNQGKISFKGLPNGDYELKESKAAPGYQLDGYSVKFRVGAFPNGDQGVTQILGYYKNNVLVRQGEDYPSNDHDGSIDWTFGQNHVSKYDNIKANADIENTNIPIQPELNLTKTNEKGRPLEGAQFRITHRKDDGTLDTANAVTLRTNAEGKLNLKGLVTNDWFINNDWYTIEEVAAPVGYKLPSVRKIIEFRMEAVPTKDRYKLSYKIHTTDKYWNGNDTQTSQVKTIELTANGKATSSKQDGINFEVDADKTVDLNFEQVNHTWKKLPVTGSHTPIIIGGLVFTFAIAGVTLTRKRREA